MILSWLVVSRFTLDHSRQWTLWKLVLDSVLETKGIDYSFLLNNRHELALQLILVSFLLYS